MPLKHPELILSAPRSYRGFREICAPTWTWKYSFADIYQATERTQQAWNQWGKVQNSNGQVARMPHYVSAYMALLDGAHPGYYVVRHTVFPKPKHFSQPIFPPIPKVSSEVVCELMATHDITVDEVREAFGFELGDPAAALPTKGGSFGNDGVRWAMLQLMTDEHPYLYVEERDERQAIT
jgi:hypothetical protein